MAEWNYGNAIERFPLEAHEIWNVDDGKGIVKVHSIYADLPEFMLSADMVIVDPPWNLGLIRGYYTKADMKDQHEEGFDFFYKRLFEQLDKIAAHTVFIEIGKQNVDKFESELKDRFPFVERFEVTYFKKHPCFLLRASHNGLSAFDYSGMDEWDAILKATEIENYETVADLCMGQGLVGVGAYKAGKKFVGTELNKKRLSVLLEKISKSGGIWKQGNQ